jgi:hypothetical protein
LNDVIGSGVVVSLGLDDSWHSIAERYARATRRASVRVDTLDQIPFDCDVVVLPEAAITADLLEALYGSGRPVAPGLIWGSTRQELEREAAFRSARSRNEAQGRLFGAVGVEVRGAECFLTDQSGKQSKAGTSGEPLRRALGAGAAFLSVITHSDGVDASLGFNVACPIVGLSAPFERNAPHCVSLGVCPRRGHKPPNATAELVGPDAIKCGVLAWITCFGISTSNGAVGRRWTFVEQLRQRQGCEVIVTSWNAQFFPDAIREVLHGAMAAGKSVGQAVAEANALPGVKETGSLLAVIGDSGFRCAAQEIQPWRAGDGADNGEPARVGQEANSVVEALVFAAAKELAWAAVGKQLEQQAVVFAGAEEAQRVTTVLDAVRWLPRSMHSWLGFATECSVLSNTCPHCGAPQRIVRYGVLGQTRMIASCPNCQVYLDIDLNREFVALLDKDILEVRADGARVRIIEWAHTPMNAKIQELQGDGRYPIGSSAIGGGVRNLTIVGAWADTYSAFTYLAG